MHRSRISRPQHVKTTASTIRPVDIISLVLLAAAFASIQVLIGGTRLLFSLPAYGVLAVMALLTLFSLRRARPAPSQLCLIGAAIFLGYILARALLSPVEYLARADIYSVLGGLIVYLLVGCFFTENKLRIHFLFFLLALAAVHVGVGLAQFRRGDNFMPISWLHRFDYEWRASGFYVCPNHLAGLLEVLGVFALSLACWSRYPLWVKLLVLYAAGVCYLGLILTGSRGGYLSTVTSLVIFALISLWLSRRSESGLFWRLGILGAAGAVIIAIAVVFFVGKNRHLTERAQTIFDTTNLRVDLWQAAIQQWKLEPVFGTGSGTYLYYGRQFRTDRVQVDPVRVHNDYLDLLAEYGCVGAAALLLFLVIHLRAGWKNLGRLVPKNFAGSSRLLSNGMALQVAAIASVSAYLVHSVFDFNLHIPANVLLMAFVFGILANPGSHARDNLVSPRRTILFWRLLPSLIGIIVLIQCVRLLPGEYFAERARLALRRGHAGTALHLAETALQYEQKNPNLYDCIGQAQIKRGDARKDANEAAWFYRRALEALRAGRKLAPRDEDFVLQLAYAYDKLGRFKEAEWMYYEGLQLDPKSKWTKFFYEKHLERWRGTGQRAP